MKVSIHAKNLLNPNHMEWTNDGRLLASEFSAGRVKDVTAGGDMSNVKPFAKGLSGPASILPLDDGKVLVAENWAGKVTDISTGGDVSNAKPFISGRSNPYSLAKKIKNGTEKLYVSEHYNGRNSWISDITDPESPSIYVDNIPARPGAPGLTPDVNFDDWQHYASAGCVINWQDGGGSAHFISVGGLGQILDVTDSGGDYIDLLKNKRAVAWDLGRLGAIKEHPTNGLLYAVEPERGDVVAIDPAQPKNMRFEPPVIRGLNFPTCLRFSADGSIMYICSQGDGVVWKVEDF
ncbi:YncE family protein [Catenovulum adriaticum]|uniref:Pyrroloquinoline-quinone binding quinoprotein n=1 Tax=Catenovulum adriaticum TaxID=2984846 RepID=A0ABY7AJB0_9ALTE|nr:hypothetical protein [Catenovulum sp. TS8]WAJ69599.1 hypothetical protein OLW01_10560 [Catenovulum sp. TS8]